MKYTVEIFANGNCEDSYRTLDLSNAQAKFDSWQQDLQDDTEVKMKMYQYDEDKDEYTEINYNGEIL